MAKTGLQRGIKKADPKRYPFLFFYIGRGDKIRTCDILLPKQTLYQAEPRPDNALNVSGLCCRFQAIKACRRLLTPNAAPRPRLIPKRRGF